MLNRNYFLAFLAICLFAFSSCTKEDIDTTNTTEEETPVVVIECNGLSVQLSEEDGSIAASVTGGTAPFTYVWSTEENTNSISPEESGVYSVTVTDAIGCDISEEIVFETETGGDCDGFSMNVSQDGEVLYSYGNGGTEPYSYIWSTGETTNAITPEESGVYTVTVTDAAGCTTSGEVTAVVELDCTGFEANILHNGSGQLTVDVTGGTAPYAYAWSTGDTSDEVSVGDGVYSVEVTDALGCVTADDISVNLNPGDCDNSLSLNAPNTNTSIAFLAQSEAHLWKGASCSGVWSSYDHSYIVVDVDWNNWGTGEDYSALAISDGLPGISFGSNGAPQIGDVLSPYFISTDLFRDEAGNAVYDLDDIQVTITETSSELGGQIAGTISGTIVNTNDTNDSSTVSGSFCVTIASVCE